MKILNIIVDFIKSLISKVRKPVHVEVHETSEQKSEEVQTSQNVEVNALKLTKTVKKTADSVNTEKKAVKRRGRPRKVKPE
jgi:hypothetical protein